jgi:hypothetical protein
MMSSKSNRACSTVPAVFFCARFARVAVLRIHNEPTIRLLGRMPAGA